MKQQQATHAHTQAQQMKLPSEKFHHQPGSKAASEKEKQPPKSPDTNSNSNTPTPTPTPTPVPANMASMWVELGSTDVRKPEK